MTKDDLIYLDNNATTRVDPRVLESMIPYFTDYYANANSNHLSGLKVYDCIENANCLTADLIGARAEEIIFTSGATEAINLAVKGLLGSKRKKIVTFTTEHQAVLKTCRYMESQGYVVEYLAVESDGTIDIENFKNSITEDTLLVIVMMSNNETGTIHDIKRISSLAHSHGAMVLCDTTQCIGKISVDVNELEVDMLTISAHKFYGPKGTGALYLRGNSKYKLVEQIHGGGQQRNRRSGTLNVPGIIGLGKACEIAKSEMENDALRIIILRDKLESELLRIRDSFVVGSIDQRIYNTTNICFPKVWSEQLIISLGNIAVSNGAACSAVTTEPSHVLKALGLSDEDALSSIRFSLGRFTTVQEIDITVRKVTELVYQLRS